MKKIYFLMVCLFLFLGLQAQVQKTIENTAGQLHTLLSSTELNSITDLTLTGTMDARDFYTIRILMSVLMNLDISKVSIVAYSGNDPTLTLTEYEANVIPDRALQWKRNLTTLILPSSITAIDIGAFWGCEALSTVTVPPSVTRIGDAAFMECISLAELSMPSALTTIGVQAFDGCSSLTSLSIPSTVTFIGNNAFNNCSSITEMEIPASVTVLENGTFSECSSLTSVILPSTITSIGKNAFYRCSSLTSIELPPAIKAIEDYCFSGCTALTTLTLPSTVRSIGLNAFSDCTSLVSISVPSSVNTIGNKAFSNCTALKEIELPTALTVLEPGVFYVCTSLTSITIPSSVTSIRDEAFAGCKGLTSLVIPPLVTSVGERAFQWCENLISVTLPSSISYIGSEAFSDSPNIKNIYTNRSEPVKLNGTVFYLLDKSTCTLHVPFGSESAYAAAAEWQDFNIVSDTTGFSVSTNSLRVDDNGGEFQLTINSTIAWQASSDQPWLTLSPASGSGNATLTVRAEANSTSTYRFGSITFNGGENTSQVVSVTQKSDPAVIPITSGNLKYILMSEEKETMTSLTLTGTINASDIETLNEGFPKLEYLDLSNTKMTSTVAYYGYYPDNWWPGPSIWKNSGNIGGIYKKSLKTLKLPSTVRVLGSGAFSGSGITTLAIPPSVEIIGWSAFAFCPSLETIILPATVKDINQWVFDACTGLKEAIIEAPLTTIPRGTFVSCNSLTSITMPPTIQSIQMSAFNGCSSLPTIDLPASVVGIETAAFMGCTSLLTIYSYNPIPPSLEAGNFEEVFDACQLYVPYGSAALYADAEGWKEFVHIVEMTEFELSANELIMEAAQGSQSIKITTEGKWNTSCDKDWLTISPASGDSTHDITFTCQGNTAIEPRSAIVTFTSANGYSQAVTITQHARVNSIPVANAGVDQSAEEGALVLLDGSASADADNDVLTYQWTAPEGITLSSATESLPTFTAPSVAIDTVLTFMLMVNDGKENSLADEVIITITNKTIELGVSAHAVVFESKESSAKIRITGNAQWTATSDEDWLYITPSSGEGQKEISLTAQANDTSSERVATVTVSAPEAEDQTITVTQHTLTTGVDELSLMGITYYPNPFTTELAITVANPSLKEVSVEIFSISGQKIRTLTKAQKEANISLSWDGSDEQGKKVPHGLYLLKVNGQAKKVVFGKLKS